MLRELFQRQQEAVQYFYDHLNYEDVKEVFETFASHKGMIFFTGIGKSSYVAQKIAATMMSTGTKACYLSAVDALHGDLGMVSSGDLICIFSKSGETDELLQLLPFIRKIGAKAIAITSNANGRLAKAAEQTLILPCLAELCPYDLAPTISTTLQLLFGDVLAIGLMKSKGVTLEAFSQNHPKGQIGKRVALHVKDIMIEGENTPTCLAHQSLEEVLVDFSSKRCGCLLVVDEEKKLQGIFTDGDLRRALEKKGESVLKERLHTLMTKNPKHIGASALAWDAMKLMQENQKSPVMVLPVLEGERVVGLIKMHDLVQAGL